MIEIFPMEQNTPEWAAARLGIPTASMYATVMASGKGGGDSKTRRTYLYKLAGEIITETPAENYMNSHMERGHAMEEEARTAYEVMRSKHELTRVGFIKNGRTGCSPDSLIGKDGMVELKSKLPHLMIEVILRNDMPPEHKAQCQGQLWVSEREWVDLAVYWPGMPIFIHRCYRDEPYIKEIASAVAAFNEELDSVVEKIRKFGA